MTFFTAPPQISCESISTDQLQLVTMKASFTLATPCPELDDRIARICRVVAESACDDHTLTAAEAADFRRALESRPTNYQRSFPSTPEIDH